MEHSAPASPVVPATLVLLDVCARLAVPAALLALAHGSPDWAMLGSLVSALATAARSFLLGWWTERTIGRAWRRAVGAARRQSPAALRVREQGDVASLIAAVRESAAYDAQATPRLVALVVSLIAIAVAVALVLGPVWLVFGGVSAVCVGGLAALGHRRLYGAYDRAWDRFTEAAHDAGVLVEAGAELRAHAREDAFAAALLGRIDAMSREERFAIAWEAAMALLPAILGIAAVAGPARAGAAWAVSTLGSAAKLADVGILGGAALATGLALVRAGELAVQAAPQRRTVRAFLDASARAPAPPRGGSTPPPRSLADAVIRFDDVSCVHPGAALATPRGASHRWSGARGLAVSGENGAGKSTLALALLGLLAPASGRITIDDVPLDQIDLDAYRERVVFIPQGAFVSPGESIAWHARLYLGTSIPDARIEAALAEVGLRPVLEERAARSGKAPLDVPAGELSGGERQRMHLARALVHDAELVILDEPEAALDDGGRRALRALLERLSQTRKVLVIAHDLSIVPPAFDRLECRRDPTS